VAGSVRRFCREACLQVLGDGIMAMAYAYTCPDSWPLLYALDVCWTVQYVKSLR